MGGPCQVSWPNVMNRPAACQEAATRPPYMLRLADGRRRRRTNGRGLACVNPAVSLDLRIGGISFRNSPEIESDILERTTRLARLETVSDHQHEIGADRGVIAEIAMAVAGRFALEIDDGHP